MSKIYSINTPLLKQLKPPRTGDDDYKWASDEFTIKRSRVLRDPSMVARGIGGNITGFRADIVICDDVEVPNNCDTADKRRELRDKLTEVDFVLTAGGMQIFVGTPHTEDSLYRMAQDPLDRVFCADFKRCVLPLVNQDGNSNWAERYSLDAIESLKKRHGFAKFQSQMQLEFVRTKDQILNPELLKFTINSLNIITPTTKVKLPLTAKKWLVPVLIGIQHLV